MRFVAVVVVVVVVVYPSWVLGRPSVCAFAKMLSKPLKSRSSGSRGHLMRDGLYLVLPLLRD